MKKIVPHLWYDCEAKEAAEFYISLFEDSKLISATVIEGTPSGEAELVQFELYGLPFEAISAGPYFKFNPSISLMVKCYSIDEIQELWASLVKEGIELMPLDEYTFSKKYGWVQDRYGLSWQLLLTSQSDDSQKITPSLLFSNIYCGKAEEAVKFYTQIFRDSKIEALSRYAEGETTNKKAITNFAAFSLSGCNLNAMDNAFDVDFHFNEAFSIIVYCDTQEEIDYFWEKLSFVQEAEQCGWIKDKYGVSWQIVPTLLANHMKSLPLAKRQKLTKVILSMKKMILKEIESAIND